MASVLFTTGGTAMNVLAFSGTNFLFSQLTDMIKKKAKNMIGARKLQRAKKAWNKGRKNVLILLVKCYRYKMKQKHHTY